MAANWTTMLAMFMFMFMFSSYGISQIWIFSFYSKIAMVSYFSLRFCCKWNRINFAKFLNLFALKLSQAIFRFMLGFPIGTMQWQLKCAGIYVFGAFFYFAELSIRLKIRFKYIHQKIHSSNTHSAAQRSVERPNIASALLWNRSSHP